MIGIYRALRMVMAMAAVALTTSVNVLAAPQVSELWWIHVGDTRGLVTAITAHGPHVEIVENGVHRYTDNGGVTFHASRMPFVAPPLREAHPAGLPSVVMRIGPDGTVQRHDVADHWTTSLLLLPQNAFTGSPRVTSIAAFDKPISAAIYVATDGYSVIESIDGGDDWLRGGPGLPDHVLSLYADSVSRSLYAGTDQGLWVHHVQALPAPPNYPTSDLTTRWIGILLISGVAIAAGYTLMKAVRTQLSTWPPSASK